MYYKMTTNQLRMEQLMTKVFAHKRMFEGWDTLPSSAKKELLVSIIKRNTELALLASKELEQIIHE